MWDSIKGFIGGVFSFIFTVMLFSFISGYILGNYHGIKGTLDTPRQVSLNDFAGYAVMLFKGDPAAEKLSELNNKK